VTRVNAALRLCCVFVALIAVPAAGAGGKDLDTSFRSSALGADLHFDVYLPPGGHEHALWHRDARPWLRLALARLSLSR
jgi:hypothetical protein